MSLHCMGSHGVGYTRILKEGMVEGVEAQLGCCYSISAYLMLLDILHNGWS
jgi:hypothetical protein